VLALAADGREDAVREAIGALGELVPVAVDRHGVTIG
jgi:hypothetical protein